ncbi:MAG: hypothetical protein IH621_17350 [Krumholzibacteria bacterium]|nr:hypothetical protein [Candidatus Krumholzibacteria bacterium]
MTDRTPRPRPLRHAAFGAALAAAVVLGAFLQLSGCAANDPFDPGTVPNSPPVARIATVPVDPDSGLAPASYYKQRFRWSGTDRDGWVTEYHVSLQVPAGAPAAWDTTVRTDTTYTFVTDETGRTDATLLVVCRDDRGALSDTASQYFPIRNFPPELVYQADFNPLANMQREVAGADTTVWNFGVGNFRFYALDNDGAETMDDYYRYTLVDGEPVLTWDWDDPNADPETGWVRVPFGAGEIKEFEIWLQGVTPGARTLTVSVRDESLSDTRLQFAWEVRAPRGPVLWVPDNSSSVSRAFTREALDAAYGAGGWDAYEFLFTFPDRASVLLETLRQFEAVVWTGGGGTSQSLSRAATPGGVLQQYVQPLAGSGAPEGRLLLVSRVITGNNSGLSPAFRQGVLKISPTGAPAAELRTFDGLQVLGLDASLPSFTCTSALARAIGLAPLAGCEWVYRFEVCNTAGCFGATRPVVPFDPIVAARWPLRETAAAARVISVSCDLEYFDPAEAIAAFGALLVLEMGVSVP